MNGVPSCANDWLLTTVARDEWGFDGYVTSDCDADNDVVFSHHYTDVPEQGVADVLKAGTDVDCGGFVGKYAQSALDKKTITEADIDERLKKLFRVRMRLGHFDPDGPLQKFGAGDICSDYAIGLSQDGPAQSSALLKNDVTGHAPLLPLIPGEAGKVAVIGPNANLSESDSGYYGPHNVCGGNFWNMVDAVAKHGPAGGVVSTLGVPSVLSNDQSGIPAAVAMAKEADTVILAMGTDLSWAAEGHDAKNISFTDAQSALIAQVSAVAKRPVVLVLMTATPLDISREMANARIGAILHTGQPSVTTLGVGDLLFGVKSPAARMVQTIYPASYQDQISIFDFNLRPGPSAFVRPDCAIRCPDSPRSPWEPKMHGGACGNCSMGTNPGRTHRFYTDTPVVPFGFGLSYTTWNYTIASPVGSEPVSLDPVRAMLAATKAQGRTFPSFAMLRTSAPLVSYWVNVTNTGKMDADDVLLGFMVPPDAGKDGVPLQTLYGFSRVHVKAGETVSVNLYPTLTDFTQVDLDGSRRVQPGEYTFRFGLRETAEHRMGFAEAVVATF